MKRPWMPLYIADWRNNQHVRQMSRAARSFYLDMLLEIWSQGPLPDDYRKVARILGDDARTIKAVWSEIRPRFVVDSNGNLTHNRVESELNRAKNGGDRSAKSAEEKKTDPKKDTAYRSDSDNSTTDNKEKLSAGADLFGNPVPKPKEPKPKPEPLPFKVDDAIKAIADGSGGRFVASPLDTGKSIFVTKLIRKYPDIETWRGVGRWIANGGDGWKSAIDIRSIGDFETWVSHSQKTTGKHYANYSDPRPPVAETKEVKL